MTDSTNDPGPQATRIDRRQAMKAALGGAAAAAALTAPRIEGFSIAPDVAAASSQCAPGSQTAGTPNPLTRTSTAYGAYRCWGTGDAFAGCDFDVPAGSITVPVASSNFTAPTFDVLVGGQVSNDNGGINVAMTNFTLNEPFESCTVEISGLCFGGDFGSDGTFSTTVPSTTLTGDGAVAGRIRCSDGLTPDGRVNIKATCICGPD